MKKTALASIFITLFWSANSQTFDPDQVYLMENQFNGNIVGQYVTDPPQLGEYVLTNDKEISVLTQQENGKTYYSFCSPYGSQSGQPSDYIRFASRGEGEKLGLAKSGAIWWEMIPHVSAKGHHYGYVYLKNKDTGLYMADNTSPQNSLSLRSPNRKDGEAYLCTKKLTDPDDRHFLWYFSPWIKNPPHLNVALPQSGWTPRANKTAILSSQQALKNPTCRVTTTAGVELFTRKGIAWGTYWDHLHFYVFNLNDPALSKEGTYILETAGIQKTIVIKRDALLHPLRQHGHDQFHLSEIFDPTFGAVAQWGRLVNWWPSAYGFFSSLSYWDPWTKTSPNTFPDWMWRNDSESNKSRPIYKPYPGTATEEQAKHCLDGGWDMTDQYAHNYAADGVVLFELAQMHQRTTHAALKDKIYEEILYGVRGLLDRQEPNGSWRQGYMDQIHWTGTSAILGASLAAVLPIIQQRDTDLGDKVRQAASKAWKYVTSKESDPSSWAVKNEGRLPDGSLVSANLPSQRNMWRESYLLFAVAMYRLDPSEDLRATIEKEIGRGTIAYHGWIEKHGGKLPGQFTDKWEWAITALLLYYPNASEQTRSTIVQIVDRAYKKNIINTKNAGGPYGAYGKYLAVYGPAYTWQVWKLMMVSTLLYDTLGQAYGQGMLLAQKSLDWYWGSNPYSSSLVFGVGDTYVNSGWSSYHTIGRNTSLLAKNMHLKGIDGSYPSSETTVMGTLALWNSVLLLDKHRKSLQGVVAYEDETFRHASLFLPAGRYNGDMLKALGMGTDRIRSLKIPENFSVTLYDGDNWDGNSQTVESDAETLGSLTGRVGSLVVHYTGSLSAPEGIVPDHAPGDTPDDDTDTTHSPHESTPDATPETTPDTTPDATPEATPDTTPDVTSDVSPETTPNVTPSVTPNVTPNTVPDTTLETIPDTKTDTTPQGNSPLPSIHHTDPKSDPSPEPKADADKENIFVSFLPFGLQWLIASMLLIAGLGAYWPLREEL
jgi:hypothetical protein